MNLNLHPKSGDFEAFFDAHQTLAHSATAV